MNGYPKSSRKINRPNPASTADTEIADIVKNVSTAMKNESWTPAVPADAGAFGKEVHDRTVAALAGKEGWATNVLIDKQTKEILGLGVSWFSVNWKECVRR